MPELPTTGSGKVTSGRIVPSHRFNLESGAPTRALRTIRPQLHSVGAGPKGTLIAAHPLLWAFPLADDAKASEPLPVVEEDGGPLYPDRYDDHVRWYLPEYRLLDPGESADPVFSVREVGPGQAGDPVFAGTLKFAFEKRMPDTARDAATDRRADDPELDVREIPIERLEGELSLPYVADGEEKTDVLTTTYDPESDSLTYELRGSALRLAYAHVAERDGAEVALVGQFGAWVPVEIKSRDGITGGFNRSVSVATSGVPVVTATLVTDVVPTLRGDGSGGVGGIDFTPSLTAEVANAMKFKSVTSPTVVWVNLATGSELIKPTVSSDFQMQISGAQSGDEGTARVRGTVQTGTVRTGATVAVLPSGGGRITATVSSIRRGSQSTGSASVGDTVTVELKGPDPADISPGDRLVHPDAEAYYAEQSQILRAASTASVPCRHFGARYRFEREDGNTTVFACSPPWEGGFEPGEKYRALGADELELDDDLAAGVSVFESLDELGVFLVVPDRFLVTRTTDTHTPAVSMTSVLDPEKAEGSKIVFDAALAPDVGEFDRLRLRAHLARYLRRRLGVRKEPTMRFPASLPTGPTLDWQGPFATATSLVADGDAYVLSLQARSVSEARAVVRRLKGESHGLRGNVTFRLDDQTSASSSLLVDLGRTVGEPLRLSRTDDSSVEIQNLAPVPVEVRRLVLSQQDPPEARIHALAEPRRIDGGGAATLALPEDGATADRVATDHVIREDTSESLTEMRVDVGNLQFDVTVDTDLQPHETFAPSEGGSAQHVTQIRVGLDVDVAGDASDHITLARREDRYDSDVFSLVVPLDRFLTPEERRLEYRATFAFEDGTELRTDWSEHDFGHNPNLTVRRQELRTLLESVG